MKRLRLEHGFTVVELAVVMFVLAILVTLTVTSYRTSQDRARAANVASSIQAIESGILSMRLKDNRESWVTSNNFQGVWDANLSTFLAPSYVPASSEAYVKALRSELPQGIPKVNGVESIRWVYRNTGNTRLTTACNQTKDGVLLVITGLSKSVFTQLDRQIDDESETCGKVRYTTGKEILYQISFTQALTN